MQRRQGIPHLTLCVRDSVISLQLRAVRHLQHVLLATPVPHQANSIGGMLLDTGARINLYDAAKATMKMGAC